MTDAELDKLETWATATASIGKLMYVNPDQMLSLVATIRATEIKLAQVTVDRDAALADKAPLLAELADLRRVRDAANAYLWTSGIVPPLADAELDELADTYRYAHSSGIVPRLLAAVRAERQENDRLRQQFVPFSLRTGTNALISDLQAENVALRQTVPKVPMPVDWAEHEKRWCNSFGPTCPDHTLPEAREEHARLAYAQAVVAARRATEEGKA